MAVEVLSAHKTYPDGTVALQPVDLAIREGEFVTLLGPSGCGKSTLLKMVAGLLEPSDGRLLLWRKPVARLEEAGRKLAFVFQAPTLMPWASASCTTGRKRSMLSSMLQLMLRRLKASLAAPNTTISSGRPASAASRPLRLGVSTE